MASSTCVVMAEDESNSEESEIPKKVSKNLLDQFWKLAETHQGARVEAAFCIIAGVLEKQKLFKDEKDDESKCPELEYVLDRLVRGLSSSRKAARQGYCLALTEVIRLFPEIAVEDVVKYIEKHLPANVNQDKSQAIIGQLLAYSAVVQSGRLRDDPYMSFVAINLFNFSQGKSYLQEGIHKIIKLLFSQITPDQFKQSVWPHLKEKLACGWEKCTIDIMWYLLLIFRLFPGVVSSKFLKKHWGSDDLTDDYMDTWKKMIKQSTVLHPKFHPMCLELLEFTLFAGILKKLWKPLIDDNLFDSDVSEKKYLGFHFVREALLRTQKKNNVKCVMSPKFSSVLCRSFLTAKHPLNTAACEMVNFLCQYVKELPDPQLQIIILKAVLQLPDATNLEQILKKKEITLLISFLKPDAVKSFFDILKGIVLKKKENSVSDDPKYTKQCLAFAQIGTLISHPATFADLEWRLQVLQFLFLHSHFIVIQPFKECEMVTDWFPDIMRVACRNSLNRAMDSFNRRTTGTSLGDQSPLHQFSKLLVSVVDYAKDSLELTECLTPLFAMEEVMAPFQQMNVMVHKLNKHFKKSKRSNESYAFKILFLQLGLQLFQDGENIPSVLNDLEICCKDAIKFKGDKESNLDSVESLPWDRVLLDILLSLLSQSSHHMRRVVTSVFSYICPFITIEALQLIFDAINPEKQTDEDMDVEDGNEMVDEEFESGSSSSDNGSESDSDDENSDEEKQNANLEFKMKLQKVLGSASDNNDNEDSDGGATDSEMFKLDDALSELFRDRKKTLNPEEKNFLHFKLKCLDLIQIYLKSEPSMHVALQCIPPLLAAHDIGKHKQELKLLTEKILTTLAIFGKGKKFLQDDTVKSSLLQELLELLIGKANKESTTVTGNVLYNLCLFVILCEKKLKENKMEKNPSRKSSCLKLYLNALESFVNKGNCHIKPAMFMKLIDACPEYAWHFVEPLEKYAFNDDVRLHKKSQCLGLILSVVKHSKKQEFVKQENWFTLSERITKKLVEAITKVNVDSDIKPVYMTELLHLLVTINDIAKQKLDVTFISSQLELKEVLSSMSATQVKRLPKKGLQLKRKIFQLLGGEDCQNQPKKKKKKKNRNKDVEENVIPQKNNNVSEVIKLCEMNGKTSSESNDES